MNILFIKRTEGGEISLPPLLGSNVTTLLKYYFWHLSLLKKINNYKYYNIIIYLMFNKIIAGKKMHFQLPICFNYLNFLNVYYKVYYLAVPTYLISLKNALFYFFYELVFLYNLLLILTPYIICLWQTTLIGTYHNTKWVNIMVSSNLRIDSYFPVNQSLIFHPL